MKSCLFCIMIILLGCSDTMSPENKPDDILLIVQDINSRGTLISGNDSLVPRISVDGFGGFLFESRDTTLFIAQYRTKDIDMDNIRTIVISRNSIFSSTTDGNIANMHLSDTFYGEYTDSLFTDSSLKYRIIYDYHNGNMIIDSPQRNFFLTTGISYEDSITSIDSLSRYSWISGEYYNLVYAYTHHQKVVNYSWINRSKIRIIK